MQTSVSGLGGDEPPERGGLRAERVQNAAISGKVDLAIGGFGFVPGGGPFNFEAGGIGLN
jgi:hypothetical protein